MGSIPGWERCPGEGNGNPLQYSCWGNSVEKFVRGGWWATIHGVTNSQTWLSDWAHRHISNQLVKRGLEKLEMIWKYVLLPWKSLFAVSLQEPKWSLKSPYPLPAVASWKDLCCALAPRFWLLKLFSIKRNQGSLEGSWHQILGQDKARWAWNILPFTESENAHCGYPRQRDLKKALIIRVTYWVLKKESCLKKTFTGQIVKIEHQKKENK